MAKGVHKNMNNFIVQKLDFEHCVSNINIPPD
jgi:hypothetical protein